MKKMAISLLLLVGSLATASDYQIDPLAASEGTVFIVSTFEKRDYFTVFSATGTPLWEISFASKIISWKIDGGNLYIFSKMRTPEAYFLSCFETQKGELQWEKPIVAPRFEEEQMMMPAIGALMKELPMGTLATVAYSAEETQPK